MHTAMPDQEPVPVFRGTGFETRSSTVVHGSRSQSKQGRQVGVPQNSAPPSYVERLQVIRMISPLYKRTQHLHENQKQHSYCPLPAEAQAAFTMTSVLRGLAHMHQQSLAPRICKNV